MVARGSIWLLVSVTHARDKGAIVDEGSPVTNRRMQRDLGCERLVKPPSFQTGWLNEEQCLDSATHSAIVRLHTTSLLQARRVVGAFSPRS